MNTNAVVTGAELTGLPVKIDRIPEKRLIQIFVPDRPDQSLNEKLQNRGGTAPYLISTMRRVNTSMTTRTR